ncbi:MAG: phosphoenolpyruvate carboxykinase (GTP) [Candidatus Omnitrophica bacterium]|nr:phosphoenolpyruvate carboxykinase (GTP) [Candidatus Omnitrophota bacterium]
MATPLEKWVEEQARLTKPDRIHWCDGSEEEARRLMEIGEKEERIGNQNVFRKLNPETFPSSYLHRSHPTDVARTEQLTFVCHPDREMVGPNNNWMDPEEAKTKMRGLSEGCMAGRTMYVLPYVMGNPLSPYAKACVQITDISYVAVSMGIMTHMGKDVLDRIGASENFVKGFHSIGDLDPNRRFIMHFPQENLVWSIGSGYGGNALLGKKCFSLRIASWLGLKEGWLAEHMVIIGVEDPKGNVTYLVAALPSACGKTNLAMMESALPGYKIWTLGDDIAWLHIGEDGRLYALNPESGFFGVAPGTSLKTNPNMMRTLKAGTSFPTLYTNTALNVDTNEPWWEGIDGPRPENLLDWQGNPWHPDSKTLAAHPNSRFTVDIRQCPTLSPEAGNPQGVPISAIIFGGRRSDTRPLVLQGFNWQHGVFMAAMMGSETTAAAAHQVGVLRRDPMAMLPFCGYNMGDYFRHWLNMGKRLARPPEIFCINWFRKDEDGKFLWPGFGENIRVLKWIVERSHDSGSTAPRRETPAGFLPGKNEIDLSGGGISEVNLEKALAVNPEEWKAELPDVEIFLKKFGDRMPGEIWDEFNKLASSL